MISEIHEITTKGNGFDVKILREVVRVRKQDQKERRAGDARGGLFTGNKERICGKGCLMRRRSVGFHQESWRRLYVNLRKPP
jgi:Uncharacterized protein conserved in bacteria (DUF2312)